MRFDAIHVNDVYEVYYVDPNYPCNCDCHRPGSNVMHIVPCCYDRSYQGAALCLAKDKETDTILLASSSIRALVLHPSSVLRKSNSIIKLKIRERKDLKALAGF